ncbi:MAG: hypothetical protein ACRCYO_15480 [Bacteroidia bacterium]
MAACGSSPKEPEKKVVIDSAPFRRHEKTIAGLKTTVFPIPELIKPQQTPFDSFVFAKGDTIWKATYKGRLMRTSGKETTMLLDLKSEFMVDKFFLYPQANGSVVFWQATDHEGETTFIAKFEVGASKPVWKHQFRNRPNLAAPIADGNFVYVSMLGLVAQLRLSDGTFSWKHEDLFDVHRVRFARFNPAMVFDSTVVFVEIPRNNTVRPDSVRVRTRDGFLLKR